MLVFRNALFHNIEELVYDDVFGDYRIQRIPESLRLSLSERGQRSMMFASNSEIRFVMDSDEVTLELRRLPPSKPTSYHTGILQIFQGDFPGSYEIGPLPVSIDTTYIKIRRQNTAHIRRFSEVKHSFSPEVTRVLLPYDWGCAVRDIRGEIHPPSGEMLPAKRLLTYGSSMTHGGNATLPSHTYAFRLARNLGMDLIDLGCAGAAYMDESMASYIGSRNDWDAAVLEFGINVIEIWDAKQLRAAVDRFIHAVKEAHPGQSVFVTDLFYTHHDFDKDPKAALFRSAVKECTECLSSVFPNLFYINGLTLLSSWEGLSSDGLHPSDFGHQDISENLTKAMQGKI